MTAAPVTAAPVTAAPETSVPDGGNNQGILDGGVINPETTEALSDQEICDCFDLVLFGCGPERIGDRVCYYYRLADTCGRSSEFVRLFLDTKDSQRCGITTADLSSLMLDLSPSAYAMSGQYDSERVEYQLDINYDDGAEESRLFSVCFDGNRVGGTRSKGDGEFAIGFGGGNRVVRCSAPDILPDICEVDSTTPAPVTPAPVTPAPVSAAPTTPAPVTPAPVTPAPVTAQPSAAPTYVACATDDAFNIAFVLDESGSVDSTEWGVILQFVERIATFDVAGPSYVSLFEYASLVAFTQFLDWTNLATGEAAIANALQRNPYNTAGMTYTWDAVNRVLDEFYEYRQTCTDGCDTRQDILFLLTDGAPSDSVCPDMIARVNASNVDIVIVGIGEDADTWMDRVECLDYRDAGEDIFYVTEFDSDGFNAIEGLIRSKTCNGENPAGPSDRSGEPWVYEDGSIGLGPVPTASGDRDAPEDNAAVSVSDMFKRNNHHSRNGRDFESYKSGYDYESWKQRETYPREAKPIENPTSTGPDMAWLIGTLVAAVGVCCVVAMACMTCFACSMRFRAQRGAVQLQKGGYASPAEQMYVDGDAEKDELNR